jgi:uncharacterized membrane protein YphA (DoxX/SURF4 family)
MIVQIAIFGIRAALAAVLIAAGASKLADRSSFTQTLVGLGLKSTYAPMLAVTIPLLEVGLGLGLVASLWPYPVSAAVLAMLVLFSLVTLAAIQLRSRVECRCFGSLTESQFGTSGLIRVLVLTSLAGVNFGFVAIGKLRFDVPLQAVVLLSVAYLLFGICAAQAAMLIQNIRGRRDAAALR